MRRTALPLILIASFSLIAAAAPAATGSIGVWKNTGSLFDTTFDLGFDVSGVGHTPADAQAFFRGLPPDWQPKVLAACAHFMTVPATIKSPETYAFCANLLRT
jgi:hypothetical protein